MRLQKYSNIPSCLLKRISCGLRPIPKGCILARQVEATSTKIWSAPYQELS
jgi:hypothetical protein